MQLSLLTLSMLALAIAAAPTTTSDETVAARAAMVKRATVTDVGTGYASLNGGTTGGKGGTTTTVSTYAQFTAAVASDEAKIVFVTGTITASTSQVKVGSNTSILGKDYNAKLVGFGVLIKSKKNVIIRNLTIQKVLAANGDAIGVQLSTNVWIDHVDVSSDLDHDKDYYDGLIDLTHAADYVTVSNTFIHDHWKASLIGHSDSNSAEDTGHLRVTYNNNFLYNLNSRGPSIRFGTGHIFNNYYFNVADGINTRDGAQVLVQSNAWAGTVGKPLYSTDAGYAVATDNDYGGADNTALAGTMTTAPYSYALLGSANTAGAVYGVAGATLVF
ncbi:hypothetical protein BUE80_DR002572 [Diplocarpon rosae]|nr:hypothetical protein BUE80_DR002572 [Diplocarpon rosae]